MRAVTAIGASNKYNNNNDKNNALINCSLREPIGSFISIKAGNVIASNAAGEAAKTAVDGN